MTHTAIDIHCRPPEKDSLHSPSHIFKKEVTEKVYGPYRDGGSNGTTAW